MTNEPIFTTLGHLDGELRDAIRDGKDTSVLKDMLLWSVWSRKLFPYNDIQEGQTIYWFDKENREIGVELRVASVAREHFSDSADAYRTMETVFGIGSENTDLALVNREAPKAGYLLVVAVEAVAYLGTPLDLSLIHI